LLEFLRNLDILANKVLKCVKDTGYKVVVKLLLETGRVDMDLKDYDSQTLLLWAIKNRHEVVVKLLLEKGAEIEAKSSSGWTPLSWAAGKGHKAVVKLLLEKGAEIEAKDSSG
jgi:ankyrin repeat protein